MIISERQIMQLIYMVSPLVCENAYLNEVGRHDLSHLLNIIANQQSSELKEIE